MSRVIGYARVSKNEQNPAAQQVELRTAGVERVFVDHGGSSRVMDRPQWLACRDYLRDGDTLVVRARPPRPSTGDVGKSIPAARSGGAGVNELELQRTVTRIALGAAASSGFALAGSGAIREHGVINRMSQDVDLFTSDTNEDTFGAWACCTDR